MTFGEWHALMGFLSGERFYPDYATVISRGSYGGYVMPMIDDSKFAHTRGEDILSKIRFYLAGRAAEVVLYGEKRGTTTGLRSDLQHATSLARDYLTCYAMEDEFMVSYLDEMDKDKLFASPIGEKIYKRINEILMVQIAETKKI